MCSFILLTRQKAHLALAAAGLEPADRSLRLSEDPIHVTFDPQATLTI